MDKQPFYICTAIAYPNGKPHIGHALEFTQADCIARYQKLSNKDVFFQTGTDEFGSKMYETAQESNIKTQELADQNSKAFLNLCEKLQIDTDNFIRTTSEQHIKGAQKLWLKMKAAGDIYKDTYEGLYCTGCEAYINESDLVDGLCPNHKKPPKPLKEENYFFKLSKYNDQIKELIQSQKLEIHPISRRNEMLALLEKGLQDISFSRPKSVLPWGVTVPDDQDHVMYVWCDALSNYITGLGYGEDQELFKKYWPADLQIIGKDILRFHAGIWIGMLLSAELEIPKAIGVHGFITSEGQKMSKSLGNVVEPLAVIEQYGSDPTRYYLLREIPTTNDGDFSQERFNSIYQSELANNLGNLVSRTVAMLHKYNQGNTTKLNLSNQIDTAIKQSWEKYHQYFLDFDIKKAIEVAGQLLDVANKYIEESKPWAMVKAGEEQQANQILTELIEVIRNATTMLLPIIPEATVKIFATLNLQVPSTFVEATNNQTPENHQINKAEPLFPRIED